MGLHQILCISVIAVGLEFPETPNSGSEGVSDSSACSRYSLPPAGLLCPASI